MSKIADKLNDVKMSIEFYKKIRSMGEVVVIPKDSPYTIDGIDIHEAMEKQIKKKADIDHIGRCVCPACLIPVDNGTTAKGLYCKWCGQRIDCNEGL